MTKTEQVDIIGIGVGPANLALLAAIDDEFSKRKDAQIRCSFLDQKAIFTWHEGMMIPYMELQVPFLRDLATLRDPTSRFTFLNYLKYRNKLDAFINLRTFYPTRIEFADYLSWACTELSDFINFACQVISIDPVWDNATKTIKALSVRYVDLAQNCENKLLTTNLVIATGQKPYIPSKLNIRNDPRVIHTSDLLKTLPVKFGDSAKDNCFVVVGAGQSAGESVLYLLNRYPNAKIFWCFRDFALHSADSNPFMNKTYHSAVIDKFYHMDSMIKEDTNFAIKRSNYSVVDLALLNDLYKFQYTEGLIHKNRLELCAGLELLDAGTSGLNLLLSFYDKARQEVVTHECQGLILATGYRADNHLPLLRNLQSYLIHDDDNNYQIERDYSIRTQSMLLPRIYLQGVCERSHGPSDQTLAVLSTRAETILNAIMHSL